jgi:MYXO-CTERM domain-containing protein
MGVSMPKLVLSCLCVAAVLVGVEVRAEAQACTQPAPGVAQINTNGITITVTVSGASVPSVNGTSCGFAASSIDIVGVTTGDDITLSNIVATMPIHIELGNGGPNLVTLLERTTDDTIACGPSTVDRNGDSVPDVNFSLSALTRLTINGRGGNDVIDCSGATYVVTLLGGDGDDDLAGGTRADTLTGGPGDDTLAGNGGNDKLTGSADADTMFGGDGNDTFVVQNNDGNDSVVGGGGTDTISYAARAAGVIAGTLGAEDAISDDTEIIRGGKGGDILDFSSGTLPHELYGGEGDDTVIGGAGADALYGQNGVDYVSGGAGLDVMNAGPGNDTVGDSADGVAETVTCGGGTDTYVANGEDTFSGCEIAGAMMRLGDDAETADAEGGCSTGAGSGGAMTMLLVGLALALRSRRR